LQNVLKTASVKPIFHLYKIIMHYKFIVDKNSREFSNNLYNGD